MNPEQLRFKNMAKEIIIFELSRDIAFPDHETDETRELLQPKKLYYRTLQATTWYSDRVTIYHQTGGVGSPNTRHSVLFTMHHELRCCPHCRQTTRNVEWTHISLFCSAFVIDETVRWACTSLSSWTRFRKYKIGAVYSCGTILFRI